jgi:peptidoglycan/xylan/chitin deacetylase (PgdA/CDA1 family)
MASLATMSDISTMSNRIFLKAFSFVIFHCRITSILSYFVNRFWLKRNKDDGLKFPHVVRRKTGNLQILLYHRVNDDRDPFFPATPANVFSEQISYLADKYRVMRLDEAIERMKKKDIPYNAIVITFDDGYKDNFLNAFPILKQLSVPATIFLTTDVISTGRFLWHDRVFSAFRETQVSRLEKWYGMEREYPLTTLEEKLSAKRAVLEYVWDLDEQQRSLSVDRLLEVLQVENLTDSGGLMLNWDEIRVMQRHGIDFGSHTVTHPILSRLPDDRSWMEIAESKRVIEEQLGKQVRALAYPVGRKTDFNDVTKMLVRKAGYTCALTTMFGPNESKQDLFELRRGKPWEEDLPTFAVKLKWYKFNSQSQP